MIADTTVQNVLRDLAKPDGIGQQIARPWFHPFPARMPLPLARHLIEKLTDPSHLVLDPMSGSGTTPAAARLAGRNTIALDIDPLAVLLGRCATQPYDSKELKKSATKILNRARTILDNKNIPDAFCDEELSFVNYWFPSQSHQQLYALAEAISQEQLTWLRQISWTVLSSLIINKSKSVSYALDIARSRPHKKLDKRTPAPFEVWTHRFRVIARRLPFVDTTNDSLPASMCTRGDARTLALANNSIDFILTSPPYLNAIDYMRGHKFSLLWMGHSLKNLREVRGTALGSFRGLFDKDGLPDTMETRLQKELEKTAERARLRRYLSDLRLVFQECHRVLKPGGLAVFFFGPRLFPNRENDTAEVLSGLVDTFEQIEAVARPLNATRRSLPLPSRESGHPLSKRMRSEAVIALRKPVMK